MGSHVSHNVLSFCKVMAPITMKLVTATNGSWSLVALSGVRTLTVADRPGRWRKPWDAATVNYSQIGPYIHQDSRPAFWSRAHSLFCKEKQLLKIQRKH